MTGGKSIYMLHRVLPEIPDDIGMYRTTTVTCEQFEMFLSSNAHRPALPLSAFLEEKEIPQDAYFVTFDDGYLDNLEHALPLLEKYNVPATIFVTTGFMNGTQEPVEQSLYRMLQSIRREDLYKSLAPHYKHGSLTSRYKRLQKAANTLNAELRPEISENYMTPEQVKNISNHPLITIGAHTRTHPLLTKLGPWTLWKEIRESKKILENTVNKPVEYFSYPYGGNHIATRIAARMAGYKLAVTTKEKDVSHPADNIMALPRHDVNLMAA